MLEVILVVMIVAIATGILAPNFIHFISDYDLDTEAKKIRSKIRYWQQMSIAIQAIYQISFDTVNESYSVIYDPEGADETIETKVLEKSVGIDRTDFTGDKLNFDHFGSPSEGGGIYLSSPGGNAATISIETATGKVTIQ
jgi:type II secretory pathway pseudopilin PulG